MNLKKQLNRLILLLLSKGLLLGLVIAFTGVLLASSNLGRWLEEEVALSWLFQQRGPLPVPDEVVVVSIDQVSSQKLGLSNTPRNWPRSLHGELVNKLNQLGAAVIVFDIFFEESRNQEENILFAKALREAGNVILFQSLKKQPIRSLTSAGNIQQTGYLESLKQPIPILRDAAFGLATFSLPKVPARVNHFITFKPKLGDQPTLPLAALTTYSLPVYHLLHEMLSQTIADQITLLPVKKDQIYRPGGIQQLSQSLRRLFLNNPGLDQQLLIQLEHSSGDITVGQRSMLIALIKSLAMPHSLYLNFYGPPQTITTIPYYKILESPSQGAPLVLAGKTVFVGFSEQFQPQQKDGFYTVFSQQQSGLDLSGVEIAATAFANLLQGRTLNASSPTIDMLIYLIWAILLVLILRMLSAPLLLPAALLLGLAYHQFSYELFQQTFTWIPLAIPLFFQTPMALLAVLLWKYLESQRERRNIRHAFGQHLPIKVVDQLAKGLENITSSGEHLNGVVLATDAQQYTRLSEQLTPIELHNLMNNYYMRLFSPICNTGGVISDVVGDAALATWTSPTLDDMAQRRQACDAALNILSAEEDFNRQHPAFKLPTRMGLHYGELVMGHVGAIDHYEYRAVGDTVNTASRIEGLNKQLDTRILISKEVLQGIDGFITRKVGDFMLLGKSKPLSLYELLAKDDQGFGINTYADFVAALADFQAQHWAAAARGFEYFIQRYGADGPSQYYLNLSQQYLKHPPPEWDGVMRITTK